MRSGCEKGGSKGRRRSRRPYPFPLQGDIDADYDEGEVDSGGEELGYERHR